MDVVTTIARAEMSLISSARNDFHAGLKAKLWTLDGSGKPSNADKSQLASTAVATALGQALGVGPGPKLSPQAAGKEFERVTADFLEATFLKLGRFRPGDWHVHNVTSRTGVSIAQYEQYSHLGDVKRAAEKTPEIAVLLGQDYTIASDVVIFRNPEPDSALNAGSAIVDHASAQRASLRDTSGAKPTLHACVSCKWTLRSDRAQNARTEALNLIRFRRGRMPHIVVITAEPIPSRLSSIALGTGDIDCVYHIALPELRTAVAQAKPKDLALLDLMIAQKRIKDIADLPLDLAL